MEPGNAHPGLSRRRIIQLSLAWTVFAVVLCGWYLHHHYSSRATIEFRVQDEQGRIIHAEAKVNGKPFKAGEITGVGQRWLTITAPDCEEFKTNFFVGYFGKLLGTLPLQFSKGSIAVTVQPSPAAITLQDKLGRAFLHTNAPLAATRLPVGSYSLVIRRPNFQETYHVPISREQFVQENIVLNIGNARLESIPGDAGFSLSGSGQNLTGKLPALLEDLPVGKYRFTAQRKGWEIANDITITPGSSVTNQIDFPYGSLEVTSDPPGMNLSVAGRLIGTTPAKISEVRPGPYTLELTDEDNDLKAVVTVKPREHAKHDFVLRYGSVGLSSSPAGATVVRRGRVVGRTPLMLARMPTGATDIELRLDGYKSTNVPIAALEGGTTNYAIKLFSERFLAAMQSSQLALAQNDLKQALKLVLQALEDEASDSKAISLRDDIANRIEIQSRRDEEERRQTAEEASKRLAEQLAALPLLEPGFVISNCLAFTPNSKSEYFSELNVTQAAKNSPAGVPVAAATDVVVKGIEVAFSPVKMLRNAVAKQEQPRFHYAHFEANFRNKLFRYHGTISSIDFTNRVITFLPEGKSKESRVVIAHLAEDNSSVAPPLQNGMAVWIAGNLTSLKETNTPSPAANQLILENSKIYPPATLSNGTSASRVQTNYSGALAFRTELEKTEQGELQAVIQGRYALPEKVFQETVARFTHQSLFDSHQIKSKVTVDEARSRLVKGLKKVPTWKIVREEKTEQGLVIIQTEIKSFLARQNAVLVIGSSSRDEITVHFKLCSFALSKEPEVGLLGGVTESSYLPVHSTYANRLNIDVNLRRQSDLDIFKKKLEPELR
jgi:hypothetical protein